MHELRAKISLRKQSQALSTDAIRKWVEQNPGKGGITTPDIMAALCYGTEVGLGH